MTPLPSDSDATGGSAQSKQLRDHLVLLDRDMASAESSCPSPQIVDSQTGSVIFGDVLSPEQLATLEGFEREGLVAFVGTHAWSVSLDRGNADAIVDIASGVQDDIIDDLGEGWPEVYKGSHFEGLLLPRVVDGRPAWVIEPDLLSVPFGELSEALRGA